MLDKIRVRPLSKDLVVLDGNGRRVEYRDDGVEVAKTVHVVRRVKDGSLVLVKARKAAKKKGDE